MTSDEFLVCRDPMGNSRNIALNKILALEIYAKEAA